MSVNIQITKMRLPKEAREHLTSKLEALRKFIDLDGDRAKVAVEVGKTTAHHQKGNIFRAEITIREGRYVFRADAEEADILTAIDKMQKIILRNLRDARKKSKEAKEKGARVAKKVIKGAKK